MVYDREKRIRATSMGGKATAIIEKKEAQERIIKYKLLISTK